MTVHPRDLDEEAFHQAFEAYWEAQGGTASGLRAAISTYLEKTEQSRGFQKARIERAET